MTKPKHRRIPLPRNRYVRLALGWLLVCGGILGFLPVLGFWMVPLGLYVLSQDSPRVRRWRRQLTSWWGRSPTVGRWRTRLRRWRARIRGWLG